MTVRHFISLLDFSSGELRDLIARAIEIKQKLKQGIAHKPLEGKLLAMIFEKSSTRLRKCDFSGQSGSTLTSSI